MSLFLRPRSISLKEKSSNLKTAGKKKKKRTEMAPWRTNLIKNSRVLEPNTQSRKQRKQSLVISVNVCYRYRERVISSLMTIYLVFCKSKAKYHMLFRPLIRQAPGKQQRLPNLGAVESREGCGLWLHCSLKYLIYDNTPANF